MEVCDWCPLWRSSWCSEGINVSFLSTLTTSLTSLPQFISRFSFHNRRQAHHLAPTGACPRMPDREQNELDGFTETGEPSEVDGQDSLSHGETIVSELVQLCAVCRKTLSRMFQRSEDAWSSAPCHPTGAALQAAAHNGCVLCQTILATFPGDEARAMCADPSARLQARIETFSGESACAVLNCCRADADYFEALDYSVYLSPRAPSTQKLPAGVQSKFATSTSDPKTLAVARR